MHIIYISPQQDQRNTCSCKVSNKEALAADRTTLHAEYGSVVLGYLGRAIHGHQNSTIPATNTDLAFNRRVGNDVFPNKGVIFRVYFGWDLKQVSRIFVFSFPTPPKFPLIRTSQSWSRIWGNHPKKWIFVPWSKIYVLMVVWNIFSIYWE
jgi:hypothetical protein